MGLISDSKFTLVEGSVVSVQYGGGEVDLKKINFNVFYIKQVTKSSSKSNGIFRIRIGALIKKSYDTSSFQLCVQSMTQKCCVPVWVTE